MLHNILCIVGPIAAGKSHSLDIVTSILKKSNIDFQILKKIDLYHDLLVDSSGNKDISTLSRVDLDYEISQIYNKYGNDIGSKLLCKYLENKTTEKLYIIDGKRSYQGLKFIKDNCKNALIIAIYASIKTRKLRLSYRKRKLDLFNRFEELEESQNKIFGINMIYELCNKVIDNDLVLPHQLEMEWYMLLIENNIIQPKRQKRKLIAKKWGRKNISFQPLTEENYYTSVRSYFCTKLSSKCIIIQGGNQILTQIISNLGLDTFSVKVSSLNKQNISILISSVLSDQERIVWGNKKSRSFPFTPKKNLIFPFNKDIKVSIEADFNHALEEIKNFDVYEYFSHEVVKYLRTETKFGKFCSSHKEEYYVVDDIFYRGRTVIATKLLLAIFDVTKLKFCVLCKDPMVKADKIPGVEILNPSFTNVFENSPTSCQSYYDFLGNRFAERDYIYFHGYMDLIYNKRQDYNEFIVKKWKNEVSDWLVRNNIANTEINYTISNILFHCSAYELCTKGLVKNLLDQRSSFLGWCHPFLDFWNLFIPQYYPLKQRQNFKERIRKNIIKIKNTDLCNFPFRYKRVEYNLWLNNCINNE